MRRQVTIDGNEATTYVAYRTNEVMTIYPITPSSTMGELADAWQAVGEKNLWGTVPLVQEMQSEGGAAGAVHGALQAGALTTTFTASQGLLLMIPNMFKIAGELTSTVFHVAARCIATHALSIFGDHSDIMAARSTGWAILFSDSVQEAMDFALISQSATLRARVPFIHAFDGFRTSHEVRKIEELTIDDIRAMIPQEQIHAHRSRALSPDRPVMRGSAQNPDVFFQAREACNSYYSAVPGIVEEEMNKFAAITGRQYHLFDYFGAPDAQKVIILMGSGAETVEETSAILNEAGDSTGVVVGRLFRPFSVEHLLKALPASVRSIAVLDRTKEPGAVGEPMYQDVITAISEGLSAGTAPFTSMPKVIGGRYGLSSKEFTPAMVKAIYDELGKAKPINHFSVGITDDVTHLSLPVDATFSIEPPDVVRAIFWGLGSDGTVGANKNSIKIIGEETPNYAQGYFVYDSKKSGSMTVSHLRFGPRPIRSPYLIQSSNFVAVHQYEFLDRYPVLDTAAEGAIVLLNSPFDKDSVWATLPRPIQQIVIDRKLKLFVIDALEVARKTGMGGRINGIMQTCFFALSNVMPRDEAIERIKYAIKKSYGKRGEKVVQQNYRAVDETLENLYEVTTPFQITSDRELTASALVGASDFVRNVTAEIIAGRGDNLPVSAMPVDGTFPTGTAAWEKRNIAVDVPVWEEDLCIQCGKCVLVCPHSVIRAKVATPAALENAPEGFKTAPAKWREFGDSRYTLQVAVEDCTGCTLCVEVCPAKDKSHAGRKALNMAPQRPLRETGARDWDYFLGLKDIESSSQLIRFNTIKNAQLLQPLFEFSGACSGCGETPYIKLVTQLFGDRTVIANATGCSSIYGGNLPTTPYTRNSAGRGPAWANSLFEDNAEFGLGIRISLDMQTEFANQLLASQRDTVGAELADSILNANQSDDAGIAAQRERIESLKKALTARDTPEARDLLALVDLLARKTVWIIGGDGWAYDIGYGGLDHVLASGKKVKVLVLDTEVYSNTGGQASKSTSRGAVAKFAAGGKASAKKDLGMMAMAYRNVYVAQIAVGADDAQTLKAIREAEAYDGPAIVIAYSHCIAHGIDMSKGLSQQKLAVDSGAWMLYRYDPRRAEEGKNPLQIDSKAGSIPLADYLYSEMRYQMLRQSNPDAAAVLLEFAREDVANRWQEYSTKAAPWPEPAAAQ